MLQFFRLHDRIDAEKFESESFMKDLQKTVGIIGGMGPLATADLFMKIINYTEASADRDHIHVVIDNNPKTPDRTCAILRGTESPLPYLISSANKLKAAGADFLLIPCITSHYYFSSLQSAIDIPVVNMIEETAKYLQEQAIRKVVVLATDGTKQSGVFDAIFRKYGIEISYPCEIAQAALMDVIYKGVKAGKTEWDTTLLNLEIQKLIQEGAKAVVLGCTELPLAAEMYGLAGDLVNPTEILAKSAVRYAGYKIKE